MAIQSKISLAAIAETAPRNLDKEEIKDRTEEICEQIGDWQNRLQADATQSVLVVLQGMDSSGKDGLSRIIMRNCNPSGFAFHSFRAPTVEERNHDFLWRIHNVAPSKGQMVVFNRSHYEDVLIQRVNNWISEPEVAQRFEAINDFEQLLSRHNGTLIIKLYLHISEEKQKEKLLERIENPKKNWKHNDGDWEERKKWAEYRNAYEDVFNISKIPWHIIPADHEWYRDYMGATLVLEALQSLKLEYPLLSPEQKNKYLL